MKKFVCELGGYEVLLRGNANDARRAAVARPAEHGPVVTHDDSLQRAVNILADRWVTGVLWWGPRTYGREAILEWFRDHDLKGGLKPIVGTERERELAEAMLAGVKELERREREL